MPRLKLPPLPGETARADTVSPREQWQALALLGHAFLGSYQQSEALSVDTVKAADAAPAPVPATNALANA